MPLVNESYRACLLRLAHFILCSVLAVWIDTLVFFWLSCLMCKLSSNCRSFLQNFHFILSVYYCPYYKYLWSRRVRVHCSNSSILSRSWACSDECVFSSAHWLKTAESRGLVESRLFSWVSECRFVFEYNKASLSMKNICVSEDKNSIHIEPWSVLVL